MVKYKLLNNNKLKISIIYYTYIIAIFSIAILQIITNKRFSWAIIFTLFPFLIITVIVFVFVYLYGPKTIILLIMPIVNIVSSIIIYLYSYHIENYGNFEIANSLISYLFRLIAMYLFIFGFVTILPPLFFIIKRK